jgi:hypothetical protein
MQVWWRTVAVGYVLEPHHYLLLEAGCNAWDLMEGARLEIAKEGASYLNKDSEPRPRPECAVLRDSRIAFIRALKELNLEPPLEPKVGGVGWMPRPWEGAR